MEVHISMADAYRCSNTMSSSSPPNSPLLRKGSEPNKQPFISRGTSRIKNRHSLEAILSPETPTVPRPTKVDFSHTSSTTIHRRESFDCSRSLYGNQPIDSMASCPLYSSVTSCSTTNSNSCESLELSFSSPTLSTYSNRTAFKLPSINIDSANEQLHSDTYLDTTVQTPQSQLSKPCNATDVKYIEPKGRSIYSTAYKTPTITSTNAPRQRRRSNSTGSSTGSMGRLCRITQCTSMARSRGLCTAHGGGKKCSNPQCSNIAQSRGFCRSHGGGSRCKFEGGCPRSAQSRGLCRKHGGGQICKAIECSSSVVSSGLCRAHGGGKTCSVRECNNISQSLGLCRAHGGGRVCQEPKCKKTALKGIQFCLEHHDSRVNNAQLPPRNNNSHRIGPNSNSAVSLLPSAATNKNINCQEDFQSMRSYPKFPTDGPEQLVGPMSQATLHNKKSTLDSATKPSTFGPLVEYTVQSIPSLVEFRQQKSKQCKVPHCHAVVVREDVCQKHLDQSRIQDKLHLLCGVACS